tara:strand:- start:3464 stop:4429 length:966 start_codon:yes stop_codon:yes gene_type:complete
MSHAYLIPLALILGACSPNRSIEVPTAPSTRPEAVAKSTPAQERPLAAIDREPITLLGMRQRLMEAAGGDVLREMRLEAAIQERLDARSIEITEEAIQSEENRLLLELDDTPDTATQLLKAVRASQGLGDVRYRGLLWRNAALRALIQEDVNVDSKTTELLWRINHGPRLRTRIIVVNSFSRAATIVQELDAGQDFTRLAVDWSIDSSRDRGGLLDPFSMDDVSYPLALRKAFDDLEIGQHTNAVLLGDRYLVGRLEERLPSDGISFESIKNRLREQARLTQERILMQEEAYRLRNQPKIRIFDGTLETSFQETTPERDEP